MNPVVQQRPSPELLSLVIPLFNEQAVIGSLRERLDQVLPVLGCAVELVIVNDGSSDATWPLLTQWAAQDSRVVAVSLSRNFGHQVATSAGLHHSRGDAVVIMDGDLQDPPELIAEMLIGFREGYEVVYAQRLQRAGESLFKRATAHAFYWLMDRLVVRDLPRNTGDFRLMSRAVVDALAGCTEHRLFLRGLVSWVGFPQRAVQYYRPARVAGDTKFTLAHMLRFATDAIVTFSDLPLRAISWLGLGTVFVSLVLGMRAIYLKLFDEATVPGWASLSVAVFFLSGVILMALGTMGLYIGRIYVEVLGRPLYVIRQVVGDNATSKS